MGLDAPEETRIILATGHLLHGSRPSKRTDLTLGCAYFRERGTHRTTHCH